MQPYNSEIAGERAISNVRDLIQQTETITTTQKCLTVKNFKEKYLSLT